MKRSVTVAVCALLLAGCGSANVSAPAPTTAVATSSSAPVDRHTFCTDAVKSSMSAVDAISALVKHPDGQGLTVSQFTTPRDQMAALSATAPADLRGYLDTHVRVLDQVVTVLQTGKNENIATGDLRDASVNLLMACGSTA